MASDPGVGAIFSAGASASVFSVSVEPRGLVGVKAGQTHRVPLLRRHDDDGTRLATSIVNQ